MALDTITPKRSASCYLVSIVQYAPDLRSIRSKWAGDLTEADYPHEFIAGSDIEIRAILAWHRAGTEKVPGEKPLLVQDLLTILDRTSSDIRDIRDRALLLIGFAGALRRRSPA